MQNPRKPQLQPPPRPQPQPQPVPGTVKQEQRKKDVKEAPEEPYNPFEHRDVKKPTSNFGALAHMLKTSLGSGILAMPMAFKNSGLVFGTVSTIAVGVVCTHCIQMLVRSSQVLCALNRVPKLSFAKTLEMAFMKGPNSAKKHAKGMGYLVTVQLLGSFILGNSVYVVFISRSLFQIVQFFFHTEINTRFFILMLWIPLMLMCAIHNLKTLVPFSAIANLLVLVSFSIVVYYIFRHIQPLDHVYFIAPYDRWPLFFTTIVFSIEGIGTVLSIENEMKTPENFIGGRWRIVYVAMTIVIVVYSFIGFFGYLQYGEATEGSITLNLPVTEVLAESVKILIALAIFFTYALQFYVPINIVIDGLKGKIKPKHHTLLSLSVRAGIVTLTIIIALVVPHLEIIIELVGAICFSSLGLLMPALIDTMTRYPDLGILKWRLVKNIFIMILSIMILFCGTFHAIMSIIEEYRKQIAPVNS